VQQGHTSVDPACETESGAEQRQNGGERRAEEGDHGTSAIRLLERRVDLLGKMGRFRDQARRICDLAERLLLLGLGEEVSRAPTLSLSHSLTRSLSLTLTLSLSHSLSLSHTLSLALRPRSCSRGLAPSEQPTASHRYRGTSLIRNTHPPRTTIGP